MKRLILQSLLILLLVVVMGARTTQAQQKLDPATPGTGYDLSWYSIDNGGATSISAGPYTLSGAIGEPDAGSVSAGSYTLNGGFWAGVNVAYTAYLPLVLRGY